MFSAGCDWSPRTDVAETGANYVVTVELPGVRISDIRVEVDEQKYVKALAKNYELFISCFDQNSK